MAKEIEAQELNQTWSVVDLPQGQKLINYKWVYKVKYHSNGRIKRYKARLVIRGDKQIKGFDYTKTFAPIAKMASVRCLLSVAASERWILHQMDVHNAFLHGDLEEEVYMTLPLGFKTTNPNAVFRLQKSLYDFKQTPRQWCAKYPLNPLNMDLFSLTQIILYSPTKGVTHSQLCLFMLMIQF